MSDILVGVLALLAGLMLCFRGYWTLRLVLSIWGALIGFGLGSGLATWINDDSYLASALGWIIGIALALVFALLAYLYYAVGVILAMGSMGFALGATVTTALGVSWDWVTISVGVVVGLVVALLAIAADVPMMLLVVLSSLAGASVIVAGIMLLTGVLETADFDTATVTENIDGHWLWTLGFVLLAVAGIVSQLSHTRGIASARQGWDGHAAGHRRA
ncbi:DUF4203 domain-containing protein [Aeromicrobium sp. UC242_57]|uniref:TM7S3/TM198-like domain-containing protein n=1 Tax=Aeromicrobium sp. UC242_57 TaxID=3374624 RepID=UPI0037B560E0